MQSAEPTNAVWNSDRNLLGIKTTVIFTALNNLKVSETVYIPLVIPLSTLNMFHGHSISSQPIPSYELCIGSNLEIDYTNTVKWIPENVKLPTMISKGSTKQLLTSLISSMNLLRLQHTRVQNLHFFFNFFPVPFKNSESFFVFTLPIWKHVVARFPFLALRKSSASEMSTTYDAIIEEKRWTNYHFSYKKIHSTHNLFVAAFHSWHSGAN